MDNRELAVAADGGATRPATLSSKLLLAAVAAAALVTATSLAGRYGWFAELLTHFRLQLAAGCAVLLVLAIVLRRKTAALAAAALVACNLWPMGDYLLPAAAGAGARAAPATLRLLSLNVNLRNRDYEAVRELVAAAQPDVVGLMEVDAAWVRALDFTAADYPYRILRPQDGAYGLAILSRVPLEETPASPYVRDGVQTAIVAEAGFGGRKASIVLAHVMAPVTPARARLRNAQLEDLSAMFRKADGRHGILLGDLNITPWSPHYDVLESATGLENAARGHGYRGSWPDLPAFLRIPIDHVLLSDGLEAAAVTIAGDVGSDHRPLIVDVVAGAAARVHSAE